jgi:hypothetical protein
VEELLEDEDEDDRVIRIVARRPKVEGEVLHAYFKSHAGNPIINFLAFLVFGEGDAAPLTHEVLRRAH